MIISNMEIAAIFDQLADLLEIKGENPFKVIAYRNAVRTIENMGTDLSKMIKDGVDLPEIPTIGESIAKKIKEIVTTGKLSKLEDLKRSFPPHLLDLLNIKGIGPKRTKILYENLQINSLEELKKAALAHKIRDLEGFDEKLEQMILEGTKLVKKEGKRFLYSIAEPHANDITAYIKKSKEVSSAIIAGSFRRRKDTVGDLDLLVTSDDPALAIDHFIQYPDIKEVISRGITKSTVILNNDLQVDLRCVPDESYGATLHYFTGSKSHNVTIRKMAIEMGLKVNEYGIFKGKEKIAGVTEEEMYKTVGLSYIEPELRENRGELEAAAHRKLPDLVNIEDIKGDLHTHTTYSDGQNSIMEMAEAAKKLGYEYIAITDHSKLLAIYNGMDEKRLRIQLEEIDKINEQLDGITLLKSIEVDILEDGSLALNNDILKELDLVVGGLHEKLALSQDKQTTRILKAMDNPYFNILAHPTGRLIGERKACDIDMELLFKEVKARGCFLEINAQPKRLDLNDIHAKYAKEAGVKFAISTDAHNIATLDYMRYGIFQARRGWIEKKDAINTLSLDKLKKTLSRT
ncbi:MAG: DNA polymerase/3'-5' exonuclease PolX [Campylobacterales bacterium]|nr:DNA polymerase/3'-5' exonuclease PolX [Campylobacterales bacterium]